MILSPVTLFDCLVFVIFLTPQLIMQVGIFTTLRWIILNIFSLAGRIPLKYVYDRLFIEKKNQPPFVQIATPFQDLVIRYVRYGFANLPPSIGRTFFSKAVSLPFLRYRMLKHGYLKSPIQWQSINRTDFQGLWIVAHPDQEPDLVILYSHGGGFSMGSGHFYMEFLLAWITLLQKAGFRNPAILSLEYSLVPDAVFPTQLNQALSAYRYIFSMMNDSASKICVAGDSAGGTLTLSLLLHIRSHPRLGKPGLAVLFSPWVTVLSPLHHETPSDYLDVHTLHKYGAQYLKDVARSPLTFLASPGLCKNVQTWKDATPTNGWIVAYGAEELLRDDISSWLTLLQKGNINVYPVKAEAGIHAWPVAALYLGQSMEGRLNGLSILVNSMTERMRARK